MLKFRMLACVAAVAVLAACAVAPEPESLPVSDAGMSGEEIAAQMCSGCHATARSGSSPHPDAIPFRNLSSLYPVYAIEEALAEGIAVGHPDMPPFQMDPDEIEALLRYIESIQVKD